MFPARRLNSCRSIDSRFNNLRSLPCSGALAARCAPTPRPPGPTAAARRQATPASSPKRHPSTTLVKLVGHYHVCSWLCCRCRWQCWMQCAKARVNSGGRRTCDSGAAQPPAEEYGRGGINRRFAGVLFTGWARLGGIERRLYEPRLAVLYHSGELERRREESGGGWARNDDKGGHR